MDGGRTTKNRQKNEKQLFSLQIFGSQGVSNVSNKRYRKTIWWHGLSSHCYTLAEENEEDDDADYSHPPWCVII